MRELLLICLQFENCNSIQKSLNFCMDGKMHTSSLVTAICTISLKAFFRFIQHEGTFTHLFTV